MNEQPLDEQPLENNAPFHPALQLLLFLGCFIVGAVLAGFAVAGIGGMFGIQDIPQTLEQIQKGNFIELLLPIKLLLMVSSLAVFAFPAILFIMIAERQNKTAALSLRSFSPLKLVLGIAALFLSFPLIQWIYYANMQLLPPDAASLQVQEMQKMLINMPNLSHLFANLLLVGIIAGVGEELFFRGVLQGILQKLTQKAHLSIWITAIVFSLIHGEWQAFFPRMFLGALFGYALLRTGSLWIPMLMHIFFNSIQVLVAYFMADAMAAQTEMQTPPLLISVIFTALAATLYYFFFKNNTVSRETVEQERL